MFIHSDLQFPQVVTSRNDIWRAGVSDLSQPLEVEKKEKEIVKQAKEPQNHHRRPKKDEFPDIPKEVFYILDPMSAPYTWEERELAQLVEAEAGTQGSYGKRLVADVVLNRVDSRIFPNSIHEVIFDPYQFSVIFDGRFDAMATSVSEESLKAVRTEMIGPRLDYGILYFNSGSYCMNGSGAWRHLDHWFAY